MTTTVTIIRVATHEAVSLQELSRKTFFDAFAHLNSDADMQAFALTAFALPSFQQQLSNPDSHFFYVLVDGEIAGYIKLNYNTAQTEFRDPKGVEVERIYVLQAYQGKQIGKQLLDFAIQTAIDKGLSYIWLGVWEHNSGAIRFYQSKGFVVIGSHPFMLGSDSQTDLLMRKDL